MAKKTLNEAVVRRFQKLANVAPINEMYNMREEEEADLAPAAGMDALDADLGADMNADADAEMGDATAEVTETEIQDAKAGLEAISSLLNQILPSGDEETMDMGDEYGEEEEEEEEEEMDEEGIMEALRGISYQPSQSEIVNEVAMRVARRLKTARLHEAKLNKALGRK